MEVPQIQFTGRVRGHSCCTTETGTQLPAVVDMAAVKVFFSGFTAFFALLRVIPELSASFRVLEGSCTISCSEFVDIHIRSVGSRQKQQQQAFRSTRVFVTFSM